MTIFPIILGAASGVTCPDRRVPGFDDTGGCGDRLATVQFHRTAAPCRRDCIEMGFASCATVTRIDECLCQNGVTTEPGVHIDGAYIGWNDPLGETPGQVALKTAPAGGVLGAAGAYYYLFAANDTTNLNCPIDEAHWDPLLINGAANQVNMVAVPLAFDVDGNCINGAITIPLVDLNLEDTALPCVQTGGRRAFAILVLDANGDRLMFCPLPGILPPPRCDRRPCCDWSILTFQVDSNAGGSAHVSATLSRPPDCECPPTATITLNGATYTMGPTDPPFLSIEDDIPYDPDAAPPDTATLTLDWVYSGCPDCTDGHDERTIPLSLT